jgi:hypothetical protein
MKKELKQSWKVKVEFVQSFYNVYIDTKAGELPTRQQILDKIANPLIEREFELGGHFDESDINIVKVTRDGIIFEENDGI